MILVIHKLERQRPNVAITSKNDDDDDDSLTFRTPLKLKENLLTFAPRTLAPGLSPPVWTFSREITPVKATNWYSKDSLGT